jgi:hypothetical protein
MMPGEFWGPGMMPGELLLLNAIFLFIQWTLIFIFQMKIQIHQNQREGDTTKMNLNQVNYYNLTQPLPTLTIGYQISRTNNGVAEGLL